jgi:hypothetical protein
MHRSEYHMRMERKDSKLKCFQIYHSRKFREVYYMFQDLIEDNDFLLSSELAPPTALPGKASTYREKKD